ncbi:MAG: hypothetical protein ABI759_14650 [Candidatus Solibacter sp.]
MEASVGRRSLLLLLGLVLLLRLPFLNQAIQGDDPIYLTEAQHALVDPLHPNDVKYVFLGDEVDLRGHSHPPGNAWPLAGLLLLFGEVKEIPFHAAYLVFSLLAMGAMWSLARRFSERPLWACLLFLAVPTFVVNGGSLEADLPFLAFWMASIALFLSGRVWLAAAAMAAAAMMAYQAVFLVPILFAGVKLGVVGASHEWPHGATPPPGKAASSQEWLPHNGGYWVALTPIFVLAAWQIFTRLTTGTMPAGKLAEYFSTYAFQALGNKLQSALMLFIHSWWIVFPALVPAAAMAAWRRRHEPETRFLLAWILIFFAGALAIFFSGSARYLLPMAAPVVILASRLPVRWLAPAFALQLAIALSLAWVNYEHWDGYRAFAAALRGPSAGHRVWIDNDWGLRYYLEADHGLPARKGRQVRPGDIIVSSELGHNLEFTVPLSHLADAEIAAVLPLRLIGLNSHSGYSTVSEGYLPFGFSSGPIDRVSARQVMERQAVLEYLTINAPGTAGQVVSGVFPNDRWMSKSAIVLLKTPAAPKKLRAEFYIPPNAKARQVTLVLDGREVASRAFTGPGPYTITTAEPLQGATVEIRVDQTFTAPGDQRALGMVLTGVGFVQQ